MSKYILLFLAGLWPALAPAQRIDRKAVVTRHMVRINRFDTLASLSVGNGGFAFTVDATGLQTFPEHYAKGVPLGIQADWGWHSFPNPENYQFSETLKAYPFDGRQVLYSVQQSDNLRRKAAADYFRANPHRLQLGNLGFELIRQNRTPATLADVKVEKQVLDVWKGEIRSQFQLEGQSVDVRTFCDPTQDRIFVRIQSDLLRSGQIGVRLRLPYPTGEFVDEGIHAGSPDRHTSTLLAATPTYAQIRHQLDTTRYAITFQSSTSFRINEKDKHVFVLTPTASGDVFEFSCAFSPNPPPAGVPFNWLKSARKNENAWQNFWMSGGVVDFSGTKDPRALELERRVVLSQYLTRIQCVNDSPPQETGLTYNSWFGRPHLEMHWWHGVHFAQWGRADLLQKSIDWYQTVAPAAKQIAERQGYAGIRWQKMTDPWGHDSPSSVGAFLIWQQPHLIYLTELLYRNSPQKAILEKYKDLVFATADFMAAYARYNTEKGRYDLGPGLIPAQECFNPAETFNPTFELAYWRWGLSTAQQWRKRLGLQPNPQWTEVMQKLAPLPQKDGVYLATESTPDSYTNPQVMIDHPAVLGAYGVLPQTPGLDTVVMKQTLQTILQKWTWGHTWGWDFPMVAMTATRLHQPETAIQALLMDVTTNTYLPNGHNYQDKRLRIYLPGNGALLTAVALMCTGSDQDPVPNIGFPKGWHVRWEGLKRLE